MLQIFKSIKEISANNLELGGLSLVIDSKSESRTSTGANIAFQVAVDNGIPTVYFSIESSRKEDVILRELLTILFYRYAENNGEFATATLKNWEKVKGGIVTLSKAPLFIADSISSEEPIRVMNTMLKNIISDRKVRLVIIDSVRLLEEENPIEHLEDMANDLNVAIIAIRSNIQE